MDSVDRCTYGAEAAASRSVLLVKPMNLKEMAEEYRANAVRLKKYIDKLKALSTAKYLEDYFMLQNR